ncbi:hypothetical protein [Flammeovirga pacifica]|uniref:DUF4412 domain-containing protein n=1 Tax=Flammeovirga pacifica TaxID=915059 RepID=A0A1S1YZM2_FLAPC|nr:hypothetical protein [Flammeovirga pacifica]OHX66325.1 hypothetical protein NH26_08145 [Flammeovirga pacifica]
MKLTLSYFLFIIITIPAYSQETNFFNSFMDYVEHNSDSTIFQEEYHFDKIFKVVETKGAEIHEFYIYSNNKENYFGISQKKEAQELMVFDYNTENIITFCLINNEPYAICGPFSYFNYFAPKPINYAFKKIDHIDHKKHYQSVNDSIKLDIYLSKESEFNTVGFKYGFWMMIEETSFYDIPLLDKGAIVEIKKSHIDNQLIHHALSHQPMNINKTVSFKGRKIMDFGVFKDKMKND